VEADRGGNVPAGGPLDHPPRSELLIRNPQQNCHFRQLNPCNLFPLSGRRG